MKPFEIDEKVLKLMSDVEAALRLVLEVDTEEAKDLTPVQKSLLGDLMRQANECILFMNEYSKQSYRMMHIPHYCAALSDVPHFQSKLLGRPCSRATTPL